MCFLGGGGGGLKAPPPPSKIDFRYSSSDLSETFHTCWVHCSLHTILISPLYLLAFLSYTTIKAPNGPLARTSFFSPYFKMDGWGLCYLKDNSLLFQMRERDFFIIALFNFGSIRNLKKPI